MKERHPIDDLFREGLYHSEVTPPAEVWQRVVAQRSWTHRLLAGLQRRWVLGLVIAALVGTPLTWYATQTSPSAFTEDMAASAEGLTATDMRNTPTSPTENGANAQLDNTVQPVTGAVQEPSRSPAKSALGSDAPGPGENTVAVTRVPTDDAAHASTDGTSDRSSGSSTDRRTQPSGSTSTLPEPSATSSSTQTSTAEVSNTAIAGPDEESRTASTIPEKVGAIGSPNVGRKDVSGPASTLSPSAVAMGEDYVDEEFLRVHPRDILFSRMPDSMLLSDRPLDAPYVLPNGAWWFGVQFGWSEWNGGWSGSSPLVEEMDHAETWQNGWQAGVVGGRTWKSGLSMSLGVEVASLKSQFLFTEHVQGDSDSGFTTMLDTTWQVTAVAPDSSYTVYTYSIDMVEVPNGGERDVRYSATNRYTLLNIPLELAWQKNAKRFTFAPRIGVNANFFMGRTGSTLITNTSDGRSTSVPANDPRTNDRFGMLLSGSAGLDVGYALNERVQLFMGPGYSAVLASLGSDVLRPTISGVSLRGRLVYEFGMKQRKAKP